MTASVDILTGGIRQTFTNQQMGWGVTFEGSIERTTEDITAFFGIPKEGTPFEIHLAAAALALSGQTVAEILGGSPVVESASASADGESVRKEAPANDPIPASVHEAMKDGDPWAQAEAGEKAEPEKAPEPERDDKQIMLDTIAGTGTVDALKRLWAENRPFFDANADVFAAWKARGKELSK